MDNPHQEWQWSTINPTWSTIAIQAHGLRPVGCGRLGSQGKAKRQNAESFHMGGGPHCVRSALHASVPDEPGRSNYRGAAPRLPIAAGGVPTPGRGCAALGICGFCSMIFCHPAGIRAVNGSWKIPSISFWFTAMLNSLYAVRAFPPGW